MDVVLSCQTIQLAAGQTSDHRDQRKRERGGERQSVSRLSLLLFLSHTLLTGHSIIIIIVHSAVFSSSRFRSLWATCMTVTMAASGAQLLLLALCVYRGSGLQQSAPRIRLSFKGELLQINQKSCDGEGLS